MWACTQERVHYRHWNLCGWIEQLALNAFAKSGLNSRLLRSRNNASVFRHIKELVFANEDSEEVLPGGGGQGFCWEKSSAHITKAYRNIWSQATPQRGGWDEGSCGNKQCWQGCVSMSSYRATPEWWWWWWLAWQAVATCTNDCRA